MNRRTIVLIVVGAMLVIAAPAAIAQMQQLSEGNSQGSGLTQLHEFTHVAASLSARNVQALPAANCVDGAAGEGDDAFACDGVDLLGHIPPDELGFTFINDIWGWTDPLDGSEYALIGGAEGTTFVDITDPRNPVTLGQLPTASTDGGDFWRDIKVHADHAYIVSENTDHGMQVFDLTELRDVDRTQPPVTFAETALYTGEAGNEVGSTHNLHINTDTGFAYLVGTEGCGEVTVGTGGLHVVDISDPAAPTFAGCGGEQGYVHDTQCVIYEGPDSTYEGREICVNSTAANTLLGLRNTLSITDVTDKDDPQLLSNVEYDDDGYSHQGWLTEDQGYFLHGDELDEDGGAVQETTTRIWDVRDLDAPVMIAADSLGTTSIDHNMYVEGRYMTQSNYTSGLRVQDLADVADGEVTQAAFFDMYPENDDPTFEGGTWSNYPYYTQPGVVAVSSIDRGLFILRPMVADAGGPYATAAGQPVVLDATGSMDADNPDMVVEWDLDDDGQFDDATGAQPTFDPGSLADTDAPVAVRISYDGSSAVDEAVVAVGPNAAPTAEDDAYDTVEGQTLTVEAPGVLANDTDSDDDALTAQVVDEPGHGTVDMQPDGSFTYTPDEGYAGSDVFAYEASDGIDGDSATVGITVAEAPYPVIDMDAVEDNVDRAIAWSQLTTPEEGEGGAFAQDDEVVVLLGRDDGFADSLASGGAQGALQAPLLLTGSEGLDDAVAQELQRLDADRVIILGGVAALSEQVATDLAALDLDVERLEGPTRLETAVAVAERITPDAGTTAVLARSHPAVGGGEATQAFADSLAAGALAAERDLPLVLTQTEELSATTATWLTDAGITEVLVVGGEAAISQAVMDALDALDIEATRIGAGSRAGTAVAIADERGAPTAGLADSSILIDGEDPDAWADAFPAALLASRALTPIVLTSGDAMPPATEAYLAGGGTPLICGTLTSSTVCDIAVGLLEGAAG